MTAIRISITILFLRTLFTKMFPKLRATGIHTRHYFTLPCQFSTRLTVASSIPMHHPRDSLVPCYVHCEFGPLPSDISQLEPTTGIIKTLFQAQALHNCHGSMGSCHGRRHVVFATLRCLEAAAQASTQTSYNHYIRIGPTVKNQRVKVLQLRIANFDNSNIVMAIFRISSLMVLSFHGDLTYDAVPTMIWAVAQTSTAIMLACCPLLRPVFERLMPARLTRIVVARPLNIGSSRAKSSLGLRTNPKPTSIRVTTRIDIHTESSRPRRQSCFHDKFQEQRGPTFEVERKSRNLCKAFYGGG